MNRTNEGSIRTSIKRRLSFLLVVCMLFSMIPSAAYANSNGGGGHKKFTI